MVINNLGERSFHKITALNVGSEIEVEPKFFYKPGNSGPPVVSPDQPNGVYLLSDVVRVIDMGAG
jgi:predicted transcriptional regulator